MRVRRHPVESTAVRSLGYDPASETLDVEFENRRVYQYSGVPRHVYDELTDGRSIGEYVNYEIKPLFPYREITRA